MLNDGRKEKHAYHSWHDNSNICAYMPCFILCSRGMQMKLTNEHWTIIQGIIFIISCASLLIFGLVLESNSIKTESKANKMTEQWFKDMEVGK